MNVGKVKQVIGPTVDIEFDSDKLPNILNALKIKDEKKGIDLTVEVAMHLGDNLVRCVALSSTDGLVRGMPALDTGGPITVPVGPKTLGRLLRQWKNLVFEYFYAKYYKLVPPTPSL